jgi:formate dehydrogenase major subunit
MLRGNIGTEGNGIVSCSELANKPYMLENGFVPVKNYQKLKAAAIFGEDPLYNNKMEIYEWLNDLDFLLVADTFMTETAKIAHVVLPVNPFIESDGTITNDNNVIQKVSKVRNTVTGRENWYLLKELLGLESTFEELSTEANRGFKSDELLESRYIPSEDAAEKIQLTFSHKPSIARATLELNVTRKKILEFKEEMLGKK